MCAATTTAFLKFCTMNKAVSVPAHRADAASQANDKRTSSLSPSCDLASFLDAVIPWCVHHQPCRWLHARRASLRTQAVLETNTVLGRAHPPPAPLPPAHTSTSAELSDPNHTGRVLEICTVCINHEVMSRFVTRKTSLHTTTIRCLWQLQLSIPNPQHPPSSYGTPKHLADRCALHACCGAWPRPPPRPHSLQAPTTARCSCGTWHPTTPPHSSPSQAAHTSRPSWAWHGSPMAASSASAATVMQPPGRAQQRT